MRSKLTQCTLTLWRAGRGAVRCCAGSTGGTAEHSTFQLPGHNCHLSTHTHAQHEAVQQ